MPDYDQHSVLIVNRFLIAKLNEGSLTLLILYWTQFQSSEHNTDAEADGGRGWDRDTHDGGERHLHLGGLGQPLQVGGSDNVILSIKLMLMDGTAAGTTSSPGSTTVSRRSSARSRSCAQGRRSASSWTCSSQVQSNMFQQLEFLYFDQTCQWDLSQYLEKAPSRGLVLPPQNWYACSQNLQLALGSKEPKTEAKTLRRSILFSRGLLV